MQYLTRFRLVLITLASLGGVNFVHAAGTDAGDTVTNSVTLDYTVNGGALQETSSVDFVVDRKLSLVVSASDTNYVNVTSGQEFVGQTGVPALVFTVENTGNGPSDFLLGVADKDGTLVTGFAGAPAGSFNEDAFALAIDTNSNGVYDDGVDVLVPAVGGTNYYDLGTLTEDQVQTILLVVDVPGTAAADENATYTLVATFDDGTGNAITNDESGNVQPSGTAIAAVNNPDDPAAVQNVFADIAGVAVEDTQYDFVSTPDVAFAGQDAAANGQHSDTSGFIVTGVNLQMAKLMEVIYDPISGNKYDVAGALIAGVNPKAIPGAVVMYVIGLQNAELVGGVSVESIVVADNIEDGPAPGDAEPVDEGNQSGAAVNPPAAVTIDVDATLPGVNNRTFSFLAPLNLDLVNTQVCAGTQSTQAYEAGTVLGGTDQANPEISFGLGNCAPTEDGYVIYFVTVNVAN